MKNIKIISVFLAVFFILSSVFCCTAFAAKEYTGYIVDTDVVYAELPADYELSFVDNYFYFVDSDYNSIVIEALENKTAPEGITKLTEEAVVDFFYDTYFLEGDESYAEFYKLLQVKAEKTAVNGMSAYVITGKVSDEGFVYPFCSFIMATKENIFMVTYEQTEDEELEKEDILEVLPSLAVNGTYFEGDIPTFKHDFSNAVSYKDALTKAEKEIYSDEEFYSDDILGYGYDEEMMGETIGFVKVVLVIVFIIPFAIISIVAIIMVILYIKNEKKLNSYEEKFGPLEMLKSFPGQNINFNNGNMGNFNAGTTTNNGYVPYVQTPVQTAPAQPVTATPDTHNTSSVEVPEIKNQDTVKTGSYPVIKEENLGKTEENQ